jgi:hypothetical protein
MQDNFIEYHYELSNEEASETATAAPFVVEHRRHEEAGGRFVPDARLVVAPALRASGLLATLTDEMARTLLAVLTFLTPNGHVHPTVPEVAVGLGISERQAQERLNRLMAVQWRGMPLLHRVPRDTGMDAFVPSRRLLAARDAPHSPVIAVNLPIPSSRESVIEHSRANYNRPRAEVEREVLALMGHASGEADGTPEGEALRHLASFGVSAETATSLVARFGPERVLKQAGWMGLRSARTPSRFLVAAIEGDYAPPLGAAEPAPLDDRDAAAGP